MKISIFNTHHTNGSTMELNSTREHQQKLKDIILEE